MARYWLRTIALLIPLVSLATTSTLQADEAVWHIPDDFPVGLEVPVSVDAPALQGHSLSYRMMSPDVSVPFAQRDKTTGRIWFIAKIRPESRGKKIRLPYGSLGKFLAAVDMNASESPWVANVTESRRPVMTWQLGPQSLEGKYQRANYIHPLLGLNGEVLTQDFPDDHRHHRGIFWAWHQLLVGGQRAGDGWEAKEFLSVVRKFERLERGIVHSTMRTTALWTSPLLMNGGQPVPIVESVTTIRVFRAAPASQCIDFEITLRALLPDVKIGGSENAKGYSGFTVRVKPPQDMVITDSEGQASADRVSTPALWADVSGRFGAGDAVTGVAILSHPTLPEFPPKWLLRHYGMQNVAYPGRHPVALPMDKPLTLRHRLVIHRGDVEDARIGEHQQVYAEGN